jgi:hypothetical protein
MAEVEAAEAVDVIGGESVKSGGFTGATGSPYPSADGEVVAFGVASSGSGKGVERDSVVAVIGE